MRQTLAILLDSYRELNAKKLFWFALLISGLVVVAIAGIGINDRGLTVFWWEIPLTSSNLPFTTAIIPKALFYKLIFTNVGIKIWLTWAASVLALVSTAGVIPDFVAGGTIELALSKPVGRARLYLTKFLAGLLFVTLQVTVFTLLCFVAIGVRSGSWEWRLFLAIPIVIVFFSYLYSFCALIGLVTRSTIASLLLTVIFWIFLFLLNSGDAITLMIREGAADSVSRLEPRIARMEKAARTELEKRAGGPLATEPTQEELDGANPLLPGRRKDLADARKTLHNVALWNRGFVIAKTVLPKTTETIGLLERSLISREDARKLAENAERTAPPPDPDDDGISVDDRAGQRAQDVLRNRPVWWIIGTSLCFEALILGIGAWNFSRRDY